MKTKSIKFNRNLNFTMKEYEAAKERTLASKGDPVMYKECLNHEYYIWAEMKKHGFYF